MPEQFQHGLTAYKSGWCKCGVCRKSNAERFKIQQADRAARLKADPSIREHGIPATWRLWGCRCGLCYEATHTGPPPDWGNTEREKRRRETIRKRLMRSQVKKPKALPIGRDWLHQ